MKKLALICAAIMTVAFTAPAFAADNLDLSGAFRVRYWNKSNLDYKDGNDEAYFDQRMRVKAKVKASDNAYVVIRADLGEGKWGQDFGTNAIARPSETKEIEIDRLYGVYSQDLWDVTLGEQSLSLGIEEVVDCNPTAIKLRLKLDSITPSFIYAKIDENGSLNDDGVNDDTNLYALNLNFKLASFDSNFYGAYNDNESDDTNMWAVGFMTNGKLGIVNLTGELDFLGGDAGNDVDYTGMNFYLRGDVDVTDAVNIGGQFLYAPGTDDSSEEQIANLNNWDSFTAMGSNSPAFTQVYESFSDNSGKSPFEMEDNSGVVGASIFTGFKATKDFSVGAEIGYFTPEEDSVTDLDSVTAFDLWAKYKLGSNTSVCLMYLQEMPDYDSSTADDEDIQTFYARFQVKF
jgi:hypothetical protein